MKTTAAPATRSPDPRRADKGEALKFVDQGRAGAIVVDAGERLAAFYQRHPRRVLKAGQRGIVESLKADRDRR
ncbi:hypothetical protein BH11PSE9_BH11PSE9_21120 [soil metagenome]